MRDPGVQFSKRLRSQRVEAPWAIGPHVNEAGLLEDAEVARHARLVDVHLRHQIVDSALAGEQSLDDSKTTGVGERLKDLKLHEHVYVSLCIRYGKALRRIQRGLGEQSPGWAVYWAPVSKKGASLMKASTSTRMLSAVAAVSVIALVVPPAWADVLEKTARVGGVTVQYKVVLPSGYDSAKAYPGIIALGGGPQTMNTVEGILSRNFRAEAEMRGYIVVAPAAPDGQLFFENGATIFPEFLKMLLADYKIQGGRFHIAGPSNGGIAAFHVAAANPQYFMSVTAFPGYMWQPTAAKLRAISKMCVFMYVGETDEYRWHDEMKREAEFLRSTGTVARYTVEKGQPHRLETLAGVNAARLFEGFEQTKKGCSS